MMRRRCAFWEDSTSGSDPLGQRDALIRAIAQTTPLTFATLLIPNIAHCAGPVPFGYIEAAVSDFADPRRDLAGR